MAAGAKCRLLRAGANCTAMQPAVGGDVLVTAAIAVEGSIDLCRTWRFGVAVWVLGASPVSPGRLIELSRDHLFESGPSLLR
jgi:hypothetical protein